jgi:hypothetical protein
VGFQIYVQEYGEQFNEVAAPIFDLEKQTVALSPVAEPAYRLTPERIVVRQFSVFLRHNP